ncbi:unnamed protein product [Meloidogyne enterolobii]|uniref:Uncharacterized protein n=1 Tax=Meloidogyne enterolobii TaxID=390850 RepID=A0ACB0ZTY6_MELEN
MKELVVKEKSNHRAKTGNTDKVKFGRMGGELYPKGRKFWEREWEIQVKGEID